MHTCGSQLVIANVGSCVCDMVLSSGYRCRGCDVWRVCGKKGSGLISQGKKKNESCHHRLSDKCVAVAGATSSSSPSQRKCAQHRRKREDAGMRAEIGVACVSACCVLHAPRLGLDLLFHPFLLCAYTL